MRVTVIGCSPAWNNMGGAQSGYLVEGAGRLLLDCGPGVLPRLREREGGGWPRVDAIVITHFHLDHFGDLIPWTFGAAYGPGREAPRPELWVPPGGAQTLRAYAAQFNADPIVDVFAVREYEDETPFRVAGFEVLPVRVPHYDLLTYGLRVTDGTRTLAYSGDSAPSPALVRLARDADLFLCEATLAQPEPALRGHLTEEEALATHREAGAGRLVVVHRPSELPLVEAETCAYDGFELDV